MSKVYLVGAGPGDPELITVKGRRLLARADVVLYDHLANPALLELAPASAECIYVGKKRAAHAYTQEEIIAMMIDRCKRGLNVIRLKGGDPFIFGRGGEEVEGLAAAEVLYEVVPGVTAPLGIAAYTGVPLTHRDHTSVVTFVTGHDLNAVNWSNVAGSETLVVFMGLHHVADIVRKLIAAGRSPDTPAIAVQWGTRSFQRTIAGSLERLPSLVEQAHLSPPATIIIGPVAGLRERLSWFERLPLFGHEVIVTRSRSQSEELVAKLSELGAHVVELPVIEMVPPAETAELDSCISRLETYDWIVFTSSNAVEFFAARLDDLRRIRGRICAIGRATRLAVEALKLRVDLVPAESTGEGVAAAFEHIAMKGKRVLLPRGSKARSVVPVSLAAMGATVDLPEAYRNVIPADADARIRAYLSSGRRPHWVTFTSPSTVENFLALAGRDVLAGARVATIGPTTSDEARKQGLRVDAEAKPSSVDGLIDAITRCSL